MYIDVHVHSSLSDGFHNPDKVVKYASKRVNGIAFTDHIRSGESIDLLNKRFRIYRNVKIDNLIIIPGAEFSFDYGHVIAFFPNFEYNFPNKILSDICELHDLVKDFCGILIAAHVFRPHGVREKIFSLKKFIDAIEIYPFKTRFDIYPLKIPLIAGSDAHTIWTIGFAYTVIMEFKSSIEGILECISCGNVIPVISKPYFLKRVIDSPHLIKYLIKHIY